MKRTVVMIQEGVSLLLKYKRPVVYTMILCLVALGHHLSMQMQLDSFRYIRQSVMSMLSLLCLSGAFMLLRRKKGIRADALFAFLMFMVSVTNTVSLVKGFTSGYAGVVEYRYMSFSMLVYGSTYAYFFLLYPLEAFRPGWLTPMRAILLFMPTLGMLGLYLVATRIFQVTEPVIDNWASMSGAVGNITLWLRFFILFYPVFGLMIMLRYRRNYKVWCENNYASMEHIDSKWLEDYIFGNLVITLSCLVVVFSNNPRSVLTHNFIFLFFFLYGFYRVFFRKNPYPEGYFRTSMNDAKVGIREMEQIYSQPQEGQKKTLFTSKLPCYMEKMEQWMESEKPYLRRDFKLTDAMEILPLNRSYLSRLFNEGYGMSFYQYVMRYRIAESKQLLLTRPDLTITLIADMSGFSSPSVFSRAFTQEMQCTPMQWRERHTADNHSTGTIEIA